MTLEFIGTGSFFSKTLFHNNVLINRNILIDCGFLAGLGLHASGRDFGQIEHLFITHTHADHIGGLEECAFYHKFVRGGKKPTLYLPEPLKDKLWGHSLRGGLEDIETGGASLSDYFRVVIVGEEFDIEGVAFRVVPTFHVPNKYCCGLVINRDIFFSGDTQFDAETVIKYGADAQMIFHDCQFYSGGIHASLQELSSLPQTLRKKTHLMHLPDNVAEHLDEARDLGFGIAQQHRPYTFD